VAVEAATPAVEVAAVVAVAVPKVVTPTANKS